MLAIFKQNLLRTQVSTINSSADQPAGDLATRVTVLLAPPAVTKTKSRNKKKPIKQNHKEAWVSLASLEKERRTVSFGQTRGG